MGFYINPAKGTKEDWLAREAEDIASAAPPASVHEKPDHLPVCLVDNGFFTAAGIAFSDSELAAFTQPDDSRPKQWFWVPTAKLLEVCPQVANVLN